MKRIAFFAHYDPDGLIADYVVRYLDGLYELGIEEVYFCSDSEIELKEQIKLPERTKFVKGSRHGEYDFGSWKRCLLAFEHEQGTRDLHEFDELVLCNDSCYGPLFSLRAMFETMRNKDCDFWGVTQVEFSEKYYPSFFLVMRSSVLAAPFFIRFLKSIEPFTEKRLYCQKYEEGLYRLLKKKGYRGACYLAQHNHLCHSSAQALTPAIFEQGLPFIRVMVARINPRGIAHLGEKIKEACETYEYPVALIQTHLERTTPNYESCWHYRTPDIDRVLLGIIHVRQKFNAQKKQVHLKIKVLGVSIFYCVFPMRYEPPKKAFNRR